MTDFKPFASLTSGLLARKGGARPAMRPVYDQSDSHFDDLGWNDMGHDPEAGLPQHVPSSIAGLTPAPRSPLREREGSATPPAVQDSVPVREQLRAIEAHYGEAPELEDEAAKTIAAEPMPAAVEPEPEPVSAEPPVDPVAEVVALPPRDPQLLSARGKAAFTLRLDDQRHLRLRLATAVQNRSAQRIVTEALDAYLNALPELDTLAQQVPARGGQRG